MACKFLTLFLYIFILKLHLLQLKFHKYDFEIIKILVFKLEKVNEYTKSSLKRSLGCTVWTLASDLAAALIPTTRHSCSDPTRNV
jgi:hypothetical protein